MSTHKENKRLVIKVILFTVFASLLTLLVEQVISSISEKKELTEQISRVPNIQAFNLDSTAFKLSTIKADQPSIFIHFNSTCHVCQYEAKELVQQLDKFVKCNIIMLSEESIETIQEFGEKYQLLNKHNIQLLKTEENAFFRSFGSANLPDIFIYNAENKLVKHYVGETKIEALLKIIESQ